MPTLILCPLMSVSTFGYLGDRSCWASEPPPSAAAHPFGARWTLLQYQATRHGHALGRDPAYPALSIAGLLKPGSSALSSSRKLG